MNYNVLDIELAKSVGVYFCPSEKEMHIIMEEASSSDTNWQTVTNEIGIPRNEQTFMCKRLKFSF